ncbi:MAG TPA: S-methyl-5-thioribose-1-phosphate isomerase [Methylophilaceae bacterium]|jgi:methylthioribose-1-phosphate isomerase
MKINGQQHRTIWPDPRLKFVHIIDQTLLPHRFESVQIHSVEAMELAIKTMQVRGAPLIGAAAAYGVALAMLYDDSDASLIAACKDLLATRPTAVNLQWALQRMQTHLIAIEPKWRNINAWKEAAIICDEDVKLNQDIAQHGLKLIQDLLAQQSHTPSQPFNILTHCNAGWLAAVDWGTALAPIYAAHDAGIAVHVWVDETRPRNQGASLTAWELGQHGVPHTVISDNAGGHLMQHGQVDMVIVGADRVTATGDVCNKIGTYLKALAAFDNGIPFYAAVPSPTIDWNISNGLQQIPIEQRSADEVAWVQGRLKNGEAAQVNVLPEGSPAANPAFDVTPARLVTGIITERGVCQPDKLASLFQS